MSQEEAAEETTPVTVNLSPAAVDHQPHVHPGEKRTTGKQERPRKRNAMSLFTLAQHLSKDTGQRPRWP